MNLVKFVERVVEDGITAAKFDYARPSQKQQLEGSIAGFEACKNKSLGHLAELLKQAEVRAKAERGQDNYWYHVCFREEVQWVCNCVSAALINQKMKPIMLPTGRGIMNAARILKGEE